MEEKRMMNVTVDGETRAYPYGTPYRAIAADFQDRFPFDTESSASSTRY